jgi:hypothetical protein
MIKRDSTSVRRGRGRPAISRHPHAARVGDCPPARGRPYERADRRTPSDQSQRCQVPRRGDPSKLGPHPEKMPSLACTRSSASLRLRRGSLACLGSVRPLGCLRPFSLGFQFYSCFGASALLLITGVSSFLTGPDSPGQELPCDDDLAQAMADVTGMPGDAAGVSFADPWAYCQAVGRPGRWED